MPTYEYACSKCGHKFEQFQSITAKSLRKCPQCGKMSLQRLIGGGAGIIFKGSGFYETDYRSESYKSGEKKAKQASTKTSCKDCKDCACKSNDKKAPAKKDNSAARNEKKPA